MSCQYVCVCVCVWNISADVKAHSKYACRCVVVYIQTLHVKKKKNSVIVGMLVVRFSRFSLRREMNQKKKIVAPTFKRKKKKTAQLLADQRGYLVRDSKSFF